MSGELFLNRKPGESILYKDNFGRTYLITNILTVYRHNSLIHVLHTHMTETRWTTSVEENSTIVSEEETTALILSNSVAWVVGA